MKNRQVVLLIVEGDSEEVLLYDRLRKKFKQHEVRIEVQHGDLFFNDENKPIKAVIGNRVKQFMNERKFKPSDLLAVLHIADTDGCFVTDECVKVAESGSQSMNTIYHSDCISVLNESQKLFIVRRNAQRSRNIKIMNSTNFIQIKNTAIPYQVYFFSRNLEHVIFNEPNPVATSKIENIENFVEDLEEPLEDFLSQYMVNQDFKNVYAESWRQISSNLASLQRSTNVPLLFEFVESQSGE